MSKLNTRNKYGWMNDLYFNYDFKFDPIKAYLENTQRMISRYNKKNYKKYEKWFQ